MSESIIKEKSFKFAVKVVRLTNSLQEKKEFVLSKQLMRSGTSIGANIREALNAESNRLEQGDFQTIKNDAEEILKIIKSIILTTKSKIKHKR